MNNRTIIILFAMCFLFGMYSEVSAQGKHPMIDSGQSGILVFPEDPPEDWPTYHILHPESHKFWPADPNMAFYYKGRYHLHYLYPSEEGNFGELYHLSKDPNEINNLIHSPKASLQVNKMRQVLDEALEQYENVTIPYKYEIPKK